MNYPKFMTAIFPTAIVKVKRNNMFDWSKKRVAVFALTPQGKELRDELLEGGTGQWETAELADLTTAFHTYDGLVFIMATGIVVRYIASLIKHKSEDPAVIVLDQQGHFAISLLSGHMGGANLLARMIAVRLSNKFRLCQAVITTATDVAEVTAFDVFARDHDLLIEDTAEIKYISADLIANRCVQVTIDGRLTGSFRGPVEVLPFSESRELNSEFNWSRDLNRVVVSSTKDLPSLPSAPHCLWLRPKDIFLGIGCKRNTEPEQLIEYIKMKLAEYNISELSIACIASHSVKRTELALQRAAKYFKCDLKFYDPIDLEPFCESVECSDFVRQTVGVGAVSAPAALCAVGGHSELIVEKIRHNGMTLSIVKKEMHYTAC
ncbi:MAG: cobalt-precorrin 5A hydrolase [Clostridiaceae bacterium]|nr:cobalt-precorrin 5A hydrolase [Clostridiaceae bacterium]